MVQSYYEDQLYLAEPSFVARPGAGLEAKADGLEAEDDGVLVTSAIRGNVVDVRGNHRKAGYWVN